MILLFFHTYYLRRRETETESGPSCLCCRGSRMLSASVLYVSSDEVGTHSPQLFSQNNLEQHLHSGTLHLTASQDSEKKCDIAVS